MPTLDTHPLRVLMVKALVVFGLDQDVEDEKGFDPRADGPLQGPGQHLAKRIQRNMRAQNDQARKKKKPIPFPGVQENGILDAPMRKALETLKPKRPTFEDAFRQIAVQDDKLDGEEYYTQGAMRWQGVDAVYGKVAILKTAPRLRGGDCSAGYTRWILWALQQNLGRVPHDIVNGARWQAGYTGTIQAVCQHVTTAKVGDAILYPNHVTGVFDVAARTCISHGRNAAEIYGWDSHPNRYRGFWRPVYANA